MVSPFASTFGLNTVIVPTTTILVFWAADRVAFTVYWKAALPLGCVALFRSTSFVMPQE